MPPGFAMFLWKLSVLIGLALAFLLYAGVYDITQSPSHSAIAVAIVLIVWIGILIAMLKNKK